MTTGSVIQQSDSIQSRIQSFAFIIAACIAVLFSVCFVVSGFANFRLPGEIEMESRINPNNASAASLVRLPGIGVARAEAIIAHREDFSSIDGNKAAFESADDLQKIKGIGPKTVENINKWLKFE